jgi:thermitase
MGRKQGPIVHSLTLLPQEEVKIYEYDRYRRATSTSARFSQRSTFFSYVSRVTETLASVKTDFGTAFSSTASVAGSSGGGIDLGIISFGGEASSSASVSVSNHLNVDSVFESFRHVAEISSQAVETERSIVVSTFEENVSVDTTFRKLRNANHCHAVTYFIRRVFEVYCLSTRLVGIEAQIGGNWIDINAVPDALRDAILKQLGPIVVGQVSRRNTEIAIPTDGLLYEAELAHCSSCEPEMEKRLELELRWRWSSCWSVRTNDARAGSPTASCRSSCRAARSRKRWRRNDPPRGLPLTSARVRLTGNFTVEGKAYPMKKTTLDRDEDRNRYHLRLTCRSA